MSEPSTIRVRLAKWPDDRDALRLIRETVFVEEQKVPLALEWDDQDEHAIHVLAFDMENNPIGTGRLLPNGQIGRMAVLKNWRNKGVGQALLKALIESTAGKPLPPLFLNAQKDAVRFYEKEGFTITGPEFMEANIPHYRMEMSHE